MHGGATPREANKALQVCPIRIHKPVNAQGTNSKDKNELLWSTFNTNYNNIPAYFRKGSVLVRTDPNPVEVTIEPDAPDAPAGTEDADGDEPVPSGFTTPKAETPVPAQRTESSASSPDISSEPRRAGGSTVKKQMAPSKPYDGISGEIVVLHEDIIRNPFWRARPWLLA